MKNVPIAFSGSYRMEGNAPKVNEDYSKVIKSPKKQAKEQMGGNGDTYWNAHSQFSGAPLPCGCYDRVKYQPNKPQCVPWNTPACAYGQNSCMGQNYPYSYATQPADFSSGAPAPFCGDVSPVPYQCPSEKVKAESETVEGFASVKNVGEKCMGNSPVPPCNANIWYSQQCQCGNAGDCAGSGTVYGCGQKCDVPNQKGGSKNGQKEQVGGGGGCQDCNYYYNKQQTYRHMLKGALYPFCPQ